MSIYKKLTAKTETTVMP